LLLLLLLLLALLFQRVEIEAPFARHVIRQEARFGSLHCQRLQLSYWLQALNAHAHVDALLRPAAVHAAVGRHVGVAPPHRDRDV
jgi:hypothetical protein